MSQAEEAREYAEIAEDCLTTAELDEIAEYLKRESAGDELRSSLAGLRCVPLARNQPLGNPPSVVNPPAGGGPERVRNGLAGKGVIDMEIVVALFIVGLFLISGILLYVFDQD